MAVNEYDVIEKIPAGLQFAFNKVAPAYIKHDTNWGFLDKAEYQEHSKELTDVSKFIYERYLLDSDKYMCFVLDKNVIKRVAHVLMPEIPAKLFDEKTIKAEEVYKSEMVKLKKYIESLITTAGSKRGYVEANIALYCLNSSNSMTDNGVEYKAFKLTYKDMMTAIGAIKGANILNFAVAHVDASKGVPKELLEKGKSFPISLRDGADCLKCFKPVFRTNAEIDDRYVAGVCFKLIVNNVT